MQPLVQQIIQKIGKPQPWLVVASIVLTVYSLYAAAKLTWLWVEGYSADYKVAAPAPVVSPQRGVGARLSVNNVVSKHLFGDATAAPVVKEEPKVQEVVGKTDLNLKLRGIYAAESDDKANAIIEGADGKQHVYFIGDQVKNARGVKLHKVHREKVILSNNGNLEALELNKAKSVVSAVPSRTTGRLVRVDANRGGPEKQVSVVDNPRVRKQLNDLRQKLRDDPVSLKDMVRWEPVMDNGIIQGVRISPGKERRLFYDMKLRRNDVITSVNGAPLNDPSQLLSLQQSLMTAGEIHLTVLRNGQAQDISIRLNDDK
ncbi:type II secretion system protein GspC [Pleionea sp. CnH1-48]|uniref:type II secretion system protein GspC n=1 Tax=Pleionea sp. CnH1-48 TaxID=2954494 RepID=UPI0020979E91|nr:type II secretion system protein GspC [Pleionea sp. CnH1-48]MCO7225205.1 type II secretion system protein GspC [Pleionea sp. CnH1-48]